MTAGFRFNSGRLNVSTPRPPRRRRPPEPESTEVVQAREAYRQTRAALDEARLAYKEARRQNQEAKERLARVRACVRAVLSSTGT
jgi:hypothetical protein